jgi:hypothetical protein
MKAASALAQSEPGRDYLHHLVSRHSSESRSAATSALSAAKKPWDIYCLLGQLREENRVSEYVDLLGALNYAKEHRAVLNALRYELQHQTNAELKVMIDEIQKAFMEADTE